jgi:hypothetical protein
VKNFASVFFVVLLTTVIGLLYWYVWVRTVGAFFVGAFLPPSRDSVLDRAYWLIVGITLAPSSVPAALAFKWLWGRLVHQALSLQTTVVIYLVCQVSIPSLFYFCFVAPVITYEEAIVLFFVTFLLMAFVVFRRNRGRADRLAGIGPSGFAADG